MTAPRLSNKENHKEERISNLKKVALQYWTDIDALLIEKYIRCFDLSYEIIFVKGLFSIIPKIKKLLFSEKYLEAVRYIDILKLHLHFNVKDLLKTLVNKEKIEEAIWLIKNSTVEDKKVIFFIFHYIRPNFILYRN